MNEKKLFTKMSMVYLALFLGISCTYPFLTLYLQNRGFSNTQIGIANAILGITGVILQPIWGFATDRYSSKRKMMIILSVLNATMIINFVFAQNFVYIMVSILLLAIFQTPIIPISDAFCYEILEEHRQLQFGKIRLAGSLSYALGALGLSLIIKQFGINSIFLIYIVIMLLLAFIYKSIAFKSKSKNHEGINFGDIKKLVQNKRFVLLISAVAIGAISTGSNGTYLTVLIQKTGGDVSILGIMWFIIAITQLPVMFFGTTIIARFGELNLYIFAMLMFSLRFFLNATCTDYQMVLAVQLLESISFTIYFISVMHYLNKIVASNMKTIAMTIFAAAGGTGTLIGNLAGGMIIDALGIFQFYKIIALICLISMGIVILLKKCDKKSIYNLNVSK